MAPVNGEIQGYGVLKKHPRGGSMAARVCTCVRRGNGAGKTWDVDAYQANAAPKRHTIQY